MWLAAASQRPLQVGEVDALGAAGTDSSNARKKIFRAQDFMTERAFGCNSHNRKALVGF